MNTNSLNQLLGEPLISSREASYRLNLPLHWLSHTKERKTRRIPHYRVGKLLRFKLSELEAWMHAEQSSAREADDAGL